MHRGERVEREALASFYSAAPGCRCLRIGGVLCAALPLLPIPDGRATSPMKETRPHAAGALFVHDRTGWLGFAGTLPEHRGKGGQGAILAARIDRARAEGCDLVVTETGVPEKGRPSNSYRNILRSGFEQIYVRENYLSAA